MSCERRLRGITVQLGFEIYRRGQHLNPRETSMFARVAYGTRIYFGKLCLEAFGDAEHVLYLVDRKKKMVAFMPCKSNDDGYKLYKTSSQAWVSARNLINSLKLPDGGRIPAHWKDGMVQFSYAVPAEPDRE